MARSLSLAAYRAISRRLSPSEGIDYPPRPEGELLWVHATSPGRALALCNLGTRIQALRPGLKVLLTTNAGAAQAGHWPTDAVILTLGSDHPSLARRLVEHWRPDICLWTGGEMMPNHITCVAERGIPLVLLDIGRDELPPIRSRWLPDLARATFGLFGAILTRDDETARILRRNGIRDGRVLAAGTLRTTATPPDCREEDLEDVMQSLDGRPAWLSAGTRRGEIAPVLSAHRGALRLLHRLLLVLSLADPADRDEARRHARAMGLRCTDWDDGDIIHEEAQVLLSTDPEDLGLWYRLAPVTFVAGTFHSGPGGQNPLAAAGLGSAVLHGPEISGFETAFARLAAAKACIEVADQDALAAEVIRLSAPDQAAEMAFAAWSVATEGAELTDRVIELVLDQLDRRRGADAGT